MAFQLPGRGDESGDEEVIASINTTPLVDVMLVLLIIFLITIPVVNLSTPVVLPKERNQPRQSQPDTIVVSVDASGGLHWFDQPLKDRDALLARLREVAGRQPQPEVHLRGDASARFAMVAPVLQACTLAGIAKVSFITEPPPRH